MIFFYFRELAHEYQIPWVEYWNFLQTYADLTTEDGLELFEDFLQRQSLGLCIAEKIEKIDLKYDSDESFITANQSSNPMNSSFLNSSLFQSINGSLGHQSLSPQILEENSFLCNGLTKTSSPLNTSTNEMEESLHLPKHNIYDYGKNYMTWSMDSSDFMQESFHASASPMSCLSALFSKLSLLDRSIRQKKRSVSCNSCIGDRSGHNSHEKNVSKPYNSPPRAMEPISENSDKRDINKNIEGSELKSDLYCNGSVPNRVCEDIAEENSSDENPDRSQSPDVISNKNISLWRDNISISSSSSSLSEDNNSSSRSEIYDGDVKIMSEGSTDKTVQSQNIIVDSKFASEEKKDIENDCSNVMSDLKFELEENTSIESKEGPNTSVKSNEGPNTSVKSNDVSDKEGTSVDSLSGKFEQVVSVDEDTDSRIKSHCEQTPERKRRITSKEKPVFLHLDVVFEMNKNKTPENVFEGLFEAVNERRKSNMNLDEMDFMKYGDDVWSREFVIDYDLTQSELKEGLEIYATVAVVPLSLNLHEMKVFPRVPFKLTSCEYLKIDDIHFSESTVIVNVKFNFVREQMKQALLVSNSFQMRSYFING